MTADLSTPTKDRFWRRIAHALGDFGDALDATEASLLEARVAKLERQLVELKSRRDC
jgi:hypothetical protein